MKTDVLIVGGGLSGLAIADKLQSMGIEYCLVEARDRLGGRIQTAHTDVASYDLGPAWFWPGQPLMEAMVQRFDLSIFEQYSEGALVFEDGFGSVQRNQGFAPMRGSLRLDGGMQKVIDSLADALGESRLKTNTKVIGLSQIGKSITARMEGGTHIDARCVVLAVPPRIAGEIIVFDPALPAKTQRALSEVKTWMASQAKAVAVFETPFWRGRGLSGEAMSRRGPLVEIHDASPASGAEGALFGFIGTTFDGRRDEDKLRREVTDQLVRLFGPDAAKPKALFIKDWARDSETCTRADISGDLTHPEYGLPRAMDNVWDGKLLFAGTETASHFGGYLEGALESAVSVTNQLARHVRTERIS